MTRACYVYAIVHRMARLPRALTGLNDESLSMVPWQALAAVVSASSESRIRPDQEMLLRHEMIVETLCDTLPTLPVRFGTILPDEAAVAQALADRDEILRADLARVGHKMELGLTVLWGSESAFADHVDDEGHATYPAVCQATGDAEPGEAQHHYRGTRYLLARRASYHRERILRKNAETVASELDLHLQPYVCSSRYVVDVAPNLAIRASLLVDRGTLAEAKGALNECRSLYPALRFLITGPWPPYSFVSPPSPQVE